MPYRDPNSEDLKSSLFNAIWNSIKTWDINVPEEYSGYTGAMGNHAMAIMDEVMTTIKNVLESSGNDLANALVSDDRFERQCAELVYKIQKSKLPEPRDDFYAMLVHQEIQMWVNLGKVSKKDFDLIVKRRGFNQNEENLLKVGLLVNNVTFEEGV